MEEAVELLSVNPRRRFGITGDPGFTVFSLGESKPIDPDDFISMGKSTPFLGMEVEAECLLTVYGGKAVYENLSDGR